MINQFNRNWFITRCYFGLILPSTRAGGASAISAELPLLPLLSWKSAPAKLPNNITATENVSFVIGETKGPLKLAQFLNLSLVVSSCLSKECSVPNQNVKSWRSVFNFTKYLISQKVRRTFILEKASNPLKEAQWIEWILIIPLQWL